MDDSLTVSQATDLARYFLGPKWFAMRCSYGPNTCALMNAGPDTYFGRTWREAFFAAGVRLPSRRHFASVGRGVMDGDKCVATACSNTYAVRIANALNSYNPSTRGT